MLKGLSIKVKFLRSDGTTGVCHYTIKGLAQTEEAIENCLDCLEIFENYKNS